MVLLLGTLGGALVMASGVALASSRIDCYQQEVSVAVCIGTRQADAIYGTSLGETIKALAGSDYVEGHEGNDTIYGGDGNDTLYGYEGDDTIYGGPDGDDDLAGMQGNDTVYGGGGADDIDAARLDTAGSVDYSYGGGGNDSIEALDGNVDIIDCGKGVDTVYYDVGIDSIKNCEKRNPT